MDDKSVPYNLRLRKDHHRASSTEPSKILKQDKVFQEKGGEEIYGGGQVGLEYRCEKCGSSFDLETSLRSHHCKNNKSEKEGMENDEVGEEKLGETKSFRKRSRKGIPARAPFF